MSEPVRLGKVTDHWRKIVLLVGLLVAYFVLTGLVLGWHRVHQDWAPLDQSLDGPNLLVSFIWLPIAFLGGWIGGEIRNARNLEKHRLMLEEHHLKLAALLGVANPDVADALNAVPGDRQLNEGDQ